MENRKREIVKIVRDAGLPQIVQQSQNIFSELPALTFYIASQDNTQDLSGKIINQNTEVVIDLWAETSPELFEIFKQLEQAMRANNWQLTFSADVPNPDDTIYHTTARFKKIAGEIMVK